MPYKARRPTGGFKVMYEYANRLAEKGYDVTILYPLKTPFMEYRFPYWIRSLLSRLEGFRTNKWFEFHPAVQLKYVKEIRDKYVPDAGVIVATWWATVLEIGKLSCSKGKKVNLIQGFENWEGYEDLLYSSYNLPDTVNVVVASYLEKIVKQHTENKTLLIPNAIDNAEYHITIPIREKNPKHICMMYSEQKIKGSVYGLQALKIVKQKYPDLKVDCFGIWPEPEDLPEWISYYRNPDNLCEIYNNSAIFISNSLTEGFGLVSVEAMQCGCALVCTDIPGHREYAFDNETALLVQPENSHDMADKIIRLLENNEERIALAKRGNQYVSRFSWQYAVEKMDNLIKTLLENKQGC